MRWLIAIPLLWACGKDDPTREKDPRSGTPAGSTGSVATGTCTPSPDNALRALCHFELTGDATLTLSEPGHPERTLWLGSERATTLTGLAPETTYHWTVEGDAAAEGEFDTGPLPSGIPRIESVSGTASFGWILFGTDLWLLVADTEGRTVWYQELTQHEDGPQGGRISGYDWTGDGAVWHIGSKMTHMALDGTIRFEIERGIDFDRPLHHDVSYFGGRFWSMNAGVYPEPGGDMVYDGFYVFDADGILLHSWDHYDHIPEHPPYTGGVSQLWAEVFPGAQEVGHGNAVSEAPDGTILVSLRKLSQVYLLAGIAEPDFGAVRGILDGDGTGDYAITADPRVTPEPNFIGQHHPRLQGDRLTLFDNRVADLARTVTMTLSGNTAEIVETHDLGQACSIQGSVYVLENGHTVTNCSTFDFFEFEPGTDASAAPVWTMHGEDSWPAVARGIPITLPPPGW